MGQSPAISSDGHSERGLFGRRSMSLWTVLGRMACVERQFEESVTKLKSEGEDVGP